MPDLEAGVRPSRSAIGTLIGFALLVGILLSSGRDDYPGLHAVLDTGLWLLSGLLALLFSDMGKRLNRPFPRWIATSFAVTCLLEFLHVLVVVDWSGPFTRVAA